MKKAFLPLAAFALSQGLGAQEARPNIILFLVDDMGWQDTSVPFWTETTKFNEIYETPNMERLASQGMMFTQAYASSVSSPSRCSLLTGANASRHRVTNWTLHKNQGTDAASTLLELPEWNVNGICQSGGIERTFEATSFVQILKDSGYHTIQCGKAHFGAVGTPGEDPRHFGFDVNIAGHAAGGLASYLGTENFGNTAPGQWQSPFAVPGLEEYHGKDIFVTEALTLEAIKAMTAAVMSDDPFFLYMSHYAIHVPLDRDMRFYDKYIAKGLSETEAAYAALIEGMDKSLGNLMDWLEDNGLEENTVILFMSDNGGLAAAGRTPPLHVQNEPLRSGKGSAYEGGVREPMLVKWPGVVRESSRCDDYLIIEDFFPSILEIAGVQNYSTVQKVDGISFVPQLKEAAEFDSTRPLIWNFPNIWDATGPGIGPSCTIRQGDWKLIYYYETRHYELINISDDLREQNELSARHPEIVKRLAKELGTYLREVKAQRQSFKATGKACPWPDEI